MADVRLSVGKQPRWHQWVLSLSWDDSQVSPGTCSVRLDPQVHLESLSLLLSDVPGDCR